MKGGPRTTSQNVQMKMLLDHFIFPHLYFDYIISILMSTNEVGHVHFEYNKNGVLCYHERFVTGTLPRSADKDPHKLLRMLAENIGKRAC